MTEEILVVPNIMSTKLHVGSVMMTISIQINAVLAEVDLGQVIMTFTSLVIHNMLNLRQ